MISPLCLGLDTSNYTTSVALFDGMEGENVGRLLDVPAGSLGLRQSDALFQHVKHLPELFDTLREKGLFHDIGAVGASTSPRAVVGSYMPCFLAGEGVGRILADSLNAPYFPVSHQQGHLAAAAWSAGRLDLLDSSFLAWHLSGGTTELLLVEPEGFNVKAICIGGTSDISAGQLIDRTGVLLGLSFPAGRAVDLLSQEADKDLKFNVKVNNLTFSFSGVENKVKALTEQGERPENIARFALATVVSAVARTTAAAQELYPGLPVLCSGGVASNRMLRNHLTDCCKGIFAEPRYSTDNAMGTAILARRGLCSREGAQ